MVVNYMRWRQRAAIGPKPRVPRRNQRGRSAAVVGVAVGSWLVLLQIIIAGVADVTGAAAQGQLLLVEAAATLGLLNPKVTVLRLRLRLPVIEA